MTVQVKESLLNVADQLELDGVGMPLLGQANIWIEDSLENHSSIAFTQWIIERALSLTRPGQLEVIVFDDGLSGLSAPFASVNSAGERILQSINDHAEFKALLMFLRNHIQGVNNVIQGLAGNLVQFRRMIDYPVEGYKLVVLSTDVSTLDDETQNQLSVLLKAGPPAGVSFLIHSMTLGANPFLVAMCDAYAIKGGRIHSESRPVTDAWSPVDPHDLIASADRIACSLAASTMDPIHFAEVQTVDTPWTDSTTDGVTFSIGRYGLSTMEITLGDELNQRHNMLVTGAVGQGKSNLLSVVIHSLCQRYSPSELELYLLDFKEGVTLQQFTNPATGEYLPHARVIGLDADREFGVSVLRHLFAIYKDRMRLFKSRGVQNIKQYREADSGESIPRIVVIIDEFQMLFAERDRVTDESADLLVRGVRLFRACGIHLILASQTIGGNLALMGSAGEGLFGQVPVRVALKNSLAESLATLGLKNDAAAHLRAREAIVNLDYGEVTANRKTTIAYADDRVLQVLRHRWWECATPTTSPPPFVFRGENRRSLADDAEQLRLLKSQDSQFPMALLGARIDVDSGLMAVPLGREVGRNIALIGGNESLAEIESIALSLAVQASGSGARFVLLDLLDNNAAWERNKADFTRAIRHYGGELAVIGKADVPEWVTATAESLRAGADDPQDIFVIGLGLDRCREMPNEFEDICRVGPGLGRHVIGWWTKVDAFRNHVGYGGDAYFDTKIALRLDTQSAKQLMNDPLLEWKPRDNRVLVWDSMELTEPVPAIPYSEVPAAITALL